MSSYQAVDKKYCGRVGRNCCELSHLRVCCAADMQCEAEKRTNFLLCTSFLMVDRNW